MHNVHGPISEEEIRADEADAAFTRWANGQSDQRPIEFGGALLPALHHKHTSLPPVRATAQVVFHIVRADGVEREVLRQIVVLDPEKPTEINVPAGPFFLGQRVRVTVS